MSLEVSVKFPSEVSIHRMPPLRPRGASEEGVPPRNIITVNAYLFIENKGTEEVVLHASNPCDVVDWQTKKEGKLVQRDPVSLQACILPVPFRKVEPSETIIRDVTIILDGNLYEDAQSYQIVGTFWDQPWKANFTTRVTD